MTASFVQVSFTTVASNAWCFQPQAIAASAETSLFLHGFPGGSVTDPAIEKNRDIAKYVATVSGMRAIVPHYAGLGISPGKFSFKASLRDMSSLAREAASTYNTRVHLIGHSWGGLVALNIFEDIPVAHRGNLVLLSPFNDFPPDSVLRNVLELLTAEVPVVFEAGGIDGAVRELNDIKRENHPRDIARRLDLSGHQLTVIQATHDEEVSVESTREFVRLFRQPPDYIEFDADHKFSTDRDRLAQLIAGKLAK